jgi:hypothetical protein
MRSIFGEGESLDGETFPLPEIRFASFAVAHDLRKFRPSLKGRVEEHFYFFFFLFFFAGFFETFFATFFFTTTSFGRL